MMEFTVPELQSMLREVSLAASNMQRALRSLDVEEEHALRQRVSHYHGIESKLRDAIARGGIGE